MIVGKENRFTKYAVFVVVFTLFLFSAIISSAGSGSESDTNELQGQESQRPSYSQQAAFIAGVRTPSSPLADCEDRTAWKQFAAFFDRAWENYDKAQLTPMKEWASTELAAPISSRDTVYYPLSGPDFINAYTLFPRARTYILVALQPVGELPDFSSMTPDEFDDFFSGLKESLHDLLIIHYFVTAHMKTALKGEDVKGVLPVLMFFLGRERAHVLNIERWYMDWYGNIVKVPASGESQPAPANSVEGVRILFKRADWATPQTIYYFKLNLYNSSFRYNTHFLSFLKKFGPLITFMKSASYVMFEPHFSAARRFVLDQSQYVLQEDSGIPFEDFDPSVWDFSLYGVYKGPISTFKDDYQPDLAEAYRTEEGVKALPFGIGYHWEANTSNLMLGFKE